MTDDLEHLKTTLRAATPAPDPARRAANLALANANFATRHRPRSGSFRRVARLWQSIPFSGAITATTGLAAIALAVMLPQGSTPPDKTAIPAVRESAQKSEAPPEPYLLRSVPDAPAPQTALKRAAPMAGETATWPLLRAALERGQLPPKHAISIEEMVNHFSYDSPAAPDNADPLHPQVTVTETPWDENTRLVQIVLHDGSTPAPIAREITLEVAFDPAVIASYRRIGHDLRATSTGDRIEIGDMTAGQSVIAMYEITPLAPESPQSPPPSGRFTLRYLNADGQPVERSGTIRPGGPAGIGARFASAIAGFGLLLSDRQNLGTWGYPQAIALARATTGKDPLGNRAEAVELMRTAASLTQR